MCIYGVTKIGTDSVGPSRFLPPLLSALQAMKPALIFLSGAWFVLYLINRGTRTAPLTGRVLFVLLAAGVLAAADATAEIAYLAIPKKEDPASGGCCTEAFDAASGASGFLPPALEGVDAGRWLYGAYYTVNCSMILALACAGRWARKHPPGLWLAALLLGAGLSMAVNALFLVDAAAPRLLHLPYHHCPYDLVPRAPESSIAVALFLGGSFCVGWACTAGLLGDDPESRPLLPTMVSRLLYLGFLAYLGSMVMTSVELALA